MHQLRDADVNTAEGQGSGALSAQLQDAYPEMQHLSEEQLDSIKKYTNSFWDTGRVVAGLNVADPETMSTICMLIDNGEEVAGDLHEIIEAGTMDGYLQDLPDELGYYTECQDLHLEQETLIEERRPTIDTQPGDRRGVLTKDFLQRIPAGRSHQSAVQMAAGVMDGSNPNVGGASSNGSSNMPDGVRAGPDHHGAAAGFIMSPTAALDPGSGDQLVGYSLNSDGVVFEGWLLTLPVGVDTEGCALVRRLLRQKQRPPQAAVRVEEFANHFDDDFRDARVDAGEVGDGHSVTALYGLVLCEGYGPATDDIRVRYEASGADRGATAVRSRC